MLNTLPDSTVDGAVFSGAGWYYGAHVRSAGAGTMVVYDGVDTSGTVIDAFRIVAGSDHGKQFKHPVRVSTGLYLGYGGTTPASEVWYSR